MSTLIITNGGSAAKRMREAGIEDELLLWRDVLHDGPVPQRDTLEALSALRAHFIAADLGFPEEDVMRDFEERDGLFRQHPSFEEVDIWLEHDLYDQLQLVQILALFAGEQRAGLHLVQAEDYLGTLDAARLSALRAARTPVSEEQLALGRAAWEAFCAPDPERLTALLGERLRALPFLRNALLRLLADFPDPVSGLALTEQRILMALYWGPATPGDLFRAVSDAEEARFMGDISFFRRLDHLAFGWKPLVEGLDGPYRFDGDDGERELYLRAKLSLSDAGAAALDGRFDHAAGNLAERWIGGTRLTPDTLWRWDREKLVLLPPQ